MSSFGLERYFFNGANAMVKKKKETEDFFKASSSLLKLWWLLQHTSTTSTTPKMKNNNFSFFPWKRRKLRINTFLRRRCLAMHLSLIRSTSWKKKRKKVWESIKHLFGKKCVVSKIKDGYAKDGCSNQLSIA